uniref:Uncharacterized protein n=1 Tax=uncultured Sphingobacterium sp. EB080_L08E11 TaxID=710992 RepID=E0Y0K2_9SPHI|nr:hypothetical protein [uncultured Sphingobacterium sp. EB080_L08E11]
MDLYRAPLQALCYPLDLNLIDQERHSQHVLIFAAPTESTLGFAQNSFPTALSLFMAWG